VTDAPLFVLDLVLALGAALRLTRFVVADDVPGQWWIKDPLHDAKHASQRKHAPEPYVQNPGFITAGDQYPTGPEPKWARYLEGLSCPYCLSVWVAAFTTLTLFLAGGPGDAADWWRYGAGFLTLAWLTGHIAARAGDIED
jgi:hypothetical protein